jgi:hypothetical protein
VARRPRRGNPRRRRGGARATRRSHRLNSSLDAEAALDSGVSQRRPLCPPSTEPRIQRRSHAVNGPRHRDSPAGHLTARSVSSHPIWGTQSDRRGVVARRLWPARPRSVRSRPRVVAAETSSRRCRRRTLAARRVGPDISRAMNDGDVPHRPSMTGGTRRRRGGHLTSRGVASATP